MTSNKRLCITCTNVRQGSKQRSSLYYAKWPNKETKTLMSLLREDKVSLSIWLIGCAYSWEIILTHPRLGGTNPNPLLVHRSQADPLTGEPYGLDFSCS